MNRKFIKLILNCLLIQYNIRKGYLIANHDIIHSTKYTISKIFPDLYQNEFHDKILVSKNKIPKEDYKNQTKLGKILEYPSAEQFPINKRDQKLGYYIYDINVELSKKKVINLFSFIAKDLLHKEDIYLLLSNIQKSLRSDPISIYIKKIYVERYYFNQNNRLNSTPIELSFMY